ncbi:hypothetical protein L2E82_28130 [Cichorium intybus]|uniref:Uncharacterized protein n=1 Tax=Cichorium intybus TaxID=13427 RepID=A0ACB9CV67_CICIN|nr:hypothetical protein L2E82_28130 [Cichorium intybus]
MNYESNREVGHLSGSDSEVEGGSNKVLDGFGSKRNESFCKGDTLRSDDPFGLYDMLDKENNDINMAGNCKVSVDPNFLDSVEVSQAPAVLLDRIEVVAPACAMVAACEVNATLEEGSLYATVTSKGGGGRFLLGSKISNGGGEALPLLKNPLLSTSFIENMSHFIEVCEAMGYCMEGCLKNLEDIIGDNRGKGGSR